MSQKQNVKLADAEWKIMILLWNSSPLTCRQIEDELKEETGWTKHTIISFLKRMIAKKYIFADESSQPKLYYPLLNQETTVLQETRSFAQKIFGGKMGLLVSSLADSNDISKDEIDEILKSLQETLERKEEKND